MKKEQNPQINGQGDLQQASEYYQKALEIAHQATTHDVQVKAIENFSIAIAIRNDQSRFFAARGNCFKSINDYESAIKDYTQAISLNNRAGIFYANRGVCYRKLNQPIPALEDLTVAIELDSKKGGHYFNRALVLNDVGLYKEAVIDFNKTLEDGSTGYRIECRALQTRGNCYRKLGNLDKCIEDMKRAIKLDQSSSTGYGYLGQAYFEIGDYNKAIENYTQAILFNDTLSSYYEKRGVCYFKKGSEYMSNCLNDLSQCIKLDDKNAQAYFYRGSVYSMMALHSFEEEKVERDAAVAAANVAYCQFYCDDKIECESPPASGQLTCSRASARRKGIAPVRGPVAHPFILSPPTTVALQNHLNKAFADYDTAVALNPSNAQYQLGMAMLLHLKKEFSQASDLFLRLLESDQYKLISLYHAGLCWYELGDHEQAISLLTDAIDKQPNEPPFYEARGLIFSDLKLHDFAINDLSKAIELDSTNKARNFYLRGESYLSIRQFEEAIQDCSDAINLELSDVSVYNARGIAYRGIGEYELAIADLSICVAQFPANDVFRINRGFCAMDSKKYDDAIKDFQHALIQNPDNSKILFQIGLCFYYNQNYNQSITHLTIAIEKANKPDNLSQLNYYIGLAYALQQNNLLAIEYFTNALEYLSVASLDNEYTRDRYQILYMHERAKALQLAKFHKEAIQDFSDVIQANPNNAHAYFRRGFSYKALGEFLLAANDLETARILDPNDPLLVLRYKELQNTEVIVLCPPGQEKEY